MFMSIRCDYIDLGNGALAGWLVSVGPIAFRSFWAAKLPPSREGTRWLNILKILVCYRLIQPGSEWRLHREWYGKSAIADLLGEEADVVPYQKSLSMSG